MTGFLVFLALTYVITAVVLWVFSAMMLRDDLFAAERRKWLQQARTAHLWPLLALRWVFDSFLFIREQAEPEPVPVPRNLNEIRADRIETGRVSAQRLYFDPVLMEWRVAPERQDS